MRWIGSLFKEKIGSISLELGLYTGILVMVIWFADEVTRQVRFHNDVERAAATIADIMVNQTLPLDYDDPDSGIQETRISLIEKEMDQSLALGLYSDMLGLYPETELAERIEPGIRVTYLDTSSPDGDGNYPSKAWENGKTCPVDSAPNLQEFAKNLKVGNEVVKTTLVMVETCTDGTGRTLKNLAFSPKYYSYFIASPST